jgi:hypothetical protein
MSVSCGCCVLLGREFCDGQITLPEEAYRVWCVYVNVIRKNPTLGGLSPLGLLSCEKNI